MTVDIDALKLIRKLTGAGMVECRNALRETNNDKEKAIALLRKKGIIKAGKKASRKAAEGAVGHYIHVGNKIGVLLELNCETDFVAKTKEFIDLAHEIAIHVAATSPRYISIDHVKQEDVDKEMEVLKTRAKASGKTDKVIDQIIKGQIKKWYSEVCLLEQTFVKDEKKTINNLIEEAIVKFGENIMVGRFIRFSVGQPHEIDFSNDYIEIDS